MKFRGKEVMRMLGISRRQLHYWADTGLGPQPDRGASSWARYNFRDFVVLAAIARLRHFGASAQQCRRPIGELKDSLEGMNDDTLENTTFFLSIQGVAAIITSTEPNIQSHREMVLCVRQLKRQLSIFDKEERA